MTGRNVSLQSQNMSASLGAIANLLRDFLDTGIRFEAGLSLSLSVRSGRWLRRRNYVSIHSFRGPVESEMVAVHFQGFSNKPKADLEGRIQPSEMMLVTSEREKRETVISSFAEALDAELKGRKVAINATLRDYENKTESSFSLRFKDGIVSLESLRSKAAKLSWREEFIGGKMSGGSGGQ